MTKKKSLKGVKGESMLVEVLTEELPPKSLKRLSEAFAQSITEGLREKYFLAGASTTKIYATPRRLAVVVSGVVAKQSDRVIERKGPSVQAGLDANGKPTQALAGFARSCGTDPAKLQRRKDEKGEHFVFETKQKGEPLANHLAAIVEAALKKLPVAKLMRWGSGAAQFVRPVHGLILLYGNKVVPGTVLGLKSGNKTFGHRFLGRGAVTVKRAADYEKVLEKQGSVVASFDRRRTVIVKELDKAAAKLAKGSIWRLGNYEDLLDEVTSIVESPRVYTGGFDPSFLEVPGECLIVSMRQHQKYFPVADDEGKLQAKFLFVANMHPASPAEIVRGNERVLRARLSDAKFFYDQDRKVKLADRVPRLAEVVYHNKLGSQLERVQRLQKLASQIARSLNADAAGADRAAYLCKADLLTDMVGEFPELQGTMGRYYALHDSEGPVVADAIEQHYLPRAAGGDLPKGAIAQSVAAADKLDTLVGMFGIGLPPSGEKDPFGLRRAALGVLRLLIEQKLALDLKEILDQARGTFKVAMAPNVTQQLQDFFYDRLRPYLRDKGYAADEIDAVLALKPTRLDGLLARLDAIRKFRALPEGMALAAANKRIHNILRQAGNGVPGVVENEDITTPAADGALLREPSEKDLAERLGEISKRTGPLVARGDYASALKELAGLRSAVDSFFDNVMVMVDDQNLRLARLQLLARIRHEFHRIADVSRLQG